MKNFISQLEDTEYTDAVWYRDIKVIVDPPVKGPSSVMKPPSVGGQ